MKHLTRPRITIPIPVPFNYSFLNFKATIHKSFYTSQAQPTKVRKVLTTSIPPPLRSSHSTDSIPSPGEFVRPPPSEYYKYRIRRAEQGALKDGPYKSHLLPLWRFRDPSIAEKSSLALYDEFLRFYKEDDFVGMDMCRKFIQMGMTRTARYANRQGGRMYDINENGEAFRRANRRGHKGQYDKLVSGAIFKAVWQNCRVHEGYNIMKEKYKEESKKWIQDHHDGKMKDEQAHRVEEQEQTVGLADIKQKENEKEVYKVEEQEQTVGSTDIQQKEDGNEDLLRREPNNGKEVKLEIKEE